MSKEAMKLALDEFKNQREGLGEAGITDHSLDELIKTLEEALAKQEQGEPVDWRETHRKVIKALAGIVNVHTPDKLFDLDAIPRDPVMGLVQDIKAAIDKYKPPNQEQGEPVAKIEITRYGEGQALEGWRFVGKPENAPAGIYDVYTTPQQHTWVGLTETEVDKCYESIMFNPYIEPTRMGVYLEIEAKLKEKNT